MRSTESNSREAAERHLRKADPVMDRLIVRHGPCGLGTPNGHSLFHSLASAIIAQQLSAKAADTIQRRVMAATASPLNPGAIATADVEVLRAAGLSRQKAAYLLNLAEAVGTGLSKNRLRHLDDAQVVAELTAIKGIGRWTAEMYLIFGLGRLDVLSLGDAGLQRAARRLYNGGEAQDALLARVGEAWKPYRSVASWYLWQSLDNT